MLFLPAPRGPVSVKLLSSAILRGCNVHHVSTVIRQEVDLGALTGINSEKAGPDFAARFLERFFEMRRLVPDSAMPEDFVERLRSPRGAPFAEVLLEAMLAVGTAMAFSRHNLDPIGFSAIVPMGSPNRVRLVWECKAPRISRRAAEVGLVGCLELLPEALQPPEGSESFATAFAALEERARWGELSTTTAVLALAARKRGLPCEAMRGPYLRLGHGASQRLKTHHLAEYLLPLLEPRFSHIQMIRIGTKALTYWPYRFTQGEDADEFLRLCERLMQGGKPVALMAHSQPLA